MSDIYLQQKLENGGNAFGQSFSCRYMNWKRRRTIIAEVKRFLDRTSGKRASLLEVGCFEGDLTFKMNTLFAKAYALYFTGIDLSPMGIDFATHRKEFERHANCRFQVMDATRMTFDDNSFDMIVSTEVLEHMPDPVLMVKEIHRVLKPGGIAVLTSPNGGPRIFQLAARVADRLAFHAFSRRRAKNAAVMSGLSRAALQGQREEGVGHGHVSVKSYRQWNTLFRNCGFRLLRADGTGGLFFGDPLLDEHRLLFGASVIFDTMFEKAPFSYYWSEILQFSLQKR